MSTAATQAPAISLDTPRYHLRSATPADADDEYLGWFRDEGVMRFVGPDLAGLGLEQHAAIIRSCDDRTRILLVVVERESGRRVGLLRASVDPRHGRAQTTVILADPAHRGVGAVGETHRALRLFLFESRGVRKITFSVYGAHEVMLRILPRYGAVSEGVLRGHDVVPGLGVQDVHLFAMFRPG